MEYVNVEDRPRAFNLFTRVHNKLNKEISRDLSMYAGVTAAQAHVLTELHRNVGCCQKDLSERVGLDTSSLTGTMRRIENLIDRQPDKTDRRAYIIKITPEGEESLEVALHILKGLDESLKDQFDEEKISSFYEVLTFISNWSPKGG